MNFSSNVPFRVSSILKASSLALLCLAVLTGCGCNSCRKAPPAYMTPAPESEVKNAVPEPAPMPPALTDVTDKAVVNELLGLMQYPVENDGPLLSMPVSWQSAWYRIEAGDGPAAAAIRPDAAQVVRIQFVPAAPGQARHPLLEVFGFSSEAWKTAKATVGDAANMTVMEREGFVWAIVPAATNPYPADSDDFKNFNTAASALPMVLADNAGTNAEPEPAPVVAGTYVGALPAADGPGRNITLVMKTNSMAALKMEHVDRGVEEYAGRWTASGNIVAVDLKSTGAAQTPLAMSWTLRDGALVPRKWDKNLFGEAGLPLKRQ